MNSKPNISQHTKFFVFILLGICFFAESCGTKQRQSEQGMNQSMPEVQNDTLPDSIRVNRLTIIENFRRSKRNLNNDFLFNDGKEEVKATYFRLSKHQAKLFFSELEKAKKASRTSDSVRIGVCFGLGDTVGRKPNKKPNISLLAYVSTNSNNSEFVFPLKFLQQKPLKNKISKIPPGLADSMTNNWENLARKDISKHLHFNADTSKVENRIRYYTFPAKDTHSIYLYQQSNPDCDFYIYLGLWEQADYVPLRVIIRLASSKSKKPNMNGNEDEISYEFAKPCPHYCGN